MAEIPVKTLSDLLDYNPETGSLLWRRRPESMFPEPRYAETWNKRFAGRPAISAPDGAGYLQGTIQYAHVKAHRVAWAMFHGEWPSMHLDHINGIRGDNRIANLREVSVLENHRNKRPKSFRRSGLPPGVVRTKSGYFFAQLSVSGAKKYSKKFETPEEAHSAYISMCGEYGFHKNHGKTSETITAGEA